jgi:hypothetical protein
MEDNEGVWFCVLQKLCFIVVGFFGKDIVEQCWFIISKWDL